MKFSIWAKQREKYEIEKEIDVLASLIPWRGIEKEKGEISINETVKE